MIKNNTKIVEKVKLFLIAKIKKEINSISGAWINGGFEEDEKIKNIFEPYKKDFTEKYSKMLEELNLKIINENIRVIELKVEFFQTLKDLGYKFYKNKYNFKIGITKYKSMPELDEVLKIENLFKESILGELEFNVNLIDAEVVDLINKYSNLIKSVPIKKFVKEIQEICNFEKESYLKIVNNNMDKFEILYHFEKNKLKKFKKKPENDKSIYSSFYENFLYFYYESFFKNPGVLIENNIDMSYLKIKRELLKDNADIKNIIKTSNDESLDSLISKIFIFNKDIKDQNLFLKNFFELINNLDVKFFASTYLYFLEDINDENKDSFIIKSEKYFNELLILNKNKLIENMDEVKAYLEFRSSHLLYTKLLKIQREDLNVEELNWKCFNIKNIDYFNCLTHSLLRDYMDFINNNSTYMQVMYKLTANKLTDEDCFKTINLVVKDLNNIDDILLKKIAEIFIDNIIDINMKIQNIEEDDIPDYMMVSVKKMDLQIRELSLNKLLVLDKEEKSVKRKL